MSQFHRTLFPVILLIVIVGTSSGEEGSEIADDGIAAEIARNTQKRLKDRDLYFKGARIFKKMCVHCHGATGRGDGPWAKTMTTKPRNLRTGIFKFRTTPCGKLPTDSDLRRTIRTGVSGTAMPTFAEMSDSDLSSIIVFIQNLSRRWQDEKYYANPIALPSVPDWISKDSVNTQRADKGKTLFTQMCITCHGEDGSGNGPASKGLVDVWENSITPATLTAPHLKSGDRPEDLYRTIATGLDGTPMVGFNDALKTEQIWELVEFIRSLKPTNQQR